MKARTKDKKGLDHGHSAWRRWGLWTLGGVFSVSLISLVGLALWFQHLLAQFRDLERRTGAAYAELNESYPFATPSAASPIAQDRLAAYFNVRRGVMDALPPRLDEMTSRLIARGSASGLGLLTGFTAAAEPLNRAADAHVAGLRAAKMSLNEYLWLHGLVIHEIIRSDLPARDDLEITIAGLDRVFRSSNWIEKGAFSVRNFTEGLDVVFKGIPPLQAESLDPMDISRPAVRVLDVLAANQSRAAGADDSPQSSS